MELSPNSDRMIPILCSVLNENHVQIDSGFTTITTTLSMYIVIICLLSVVPVDEATALQVVNLRPTCEKYSII